LARKILFVQSQSEMGGAEYSLLTLLRHLDRSKLNPEVVLLGFGSGPLAERLRAIDVPAHELVHARLRNPFALRRARRDLTGIVRSRQIDVLVANGFHPHVYAAAAARRTGKPCVLFARDFPPGGFGLDAVIAYLAFCQETALVLAASGAVAESVRPRVRGTRVAVVPNGVEVSPFDAADRVSARAALNLADDCIAFVLAGRLQPWKGQHVFLDAALRVGRELPEAVFVIAGEALFDRAQAYARELPARARALGLGERARFPGHVDAPGLFAAADIVVHASTLPEPFGRIVIEGMAAQRPVIASRAGGPVEIIVEGETGLLVPPGDAAALAEAMLRLARDSDLRTRMGEAGRARVDASFTAERSAASFTEVLLSLEEGTHG